MESCLSLCFLGDGLYVLPRLLCVNCSADITHQVLREFGDGSMGKGIRKLAGEMLTIGGQKSYSLGYDKGVADTCATVFNQGVIAGTIITVCVGSVLYAGNWCIQKIKEHKKQKQEEMELQLEARRNFL